jgi:hypothetical protein
MKLQGLAVQSLSRFFSLLAHHSILQISMVEHLYTRLPNSKMFPFLGTRNKPERQKIHWSRNRDCMVQIYGVKLHSKRWK